MPESIPRFPASVQDKLFKTDRGDTCLCLHEAWPSLLIDLALLGPVVIVARSEQIALVSFSLQLEFLPVPGGTEMIDLGTGFCLETSRLGCVIAGQEAESGKLSLHFYDRTGFGLFKVMLASGGDIDGFAQLAEHYARDPVPQKEEPESEFAPINFGAVLAAERKHFHKNWATFPPALGCDFVPGAAYVNWWDALHLAGPLRARPLCKAGLIKAILHAHHHESPIRFTSWYGGWSQEVKLVPRRLERCSKCFHMLDVTHEAHFFFETDFEAWVGFHGPANAPAIHLFSGKGKRRAVIQFDESVAGDEAWKRLIFEAHFPLRSKS